MADQYQSMVTTESDLPKTGDPLFAGEFHRVQKDIVIVTGTAALPRGTVMGIVTVGGKYAPYDSAASDGTEDPVGVLGIATEEAADGDVTAFMYATGEFNEDLLLDVDGNPIGAAAKTALEALNIYAKPVY